MQQETQSTLSTSNGAPPQVFSGVWRTPAHAALAFCKSHMDIKAIANPFDLCLLASPELLSLFLLAALYHKWLVSSFSASLSCFAWPKAGPLYFIPLPFYSVNYLASLPYPGTFQIFLHCSLVQEGFPKKHKEEWALVDFLIVQVVLVSWFIICLLTKNCCFRCRWLRLGAAVRGGCKKD